jgi:hypothetical protein
MHITVDFWDNVPTNCFKPEPGINSISALASTIARLTIWDRYLT